MRTSFSGSGILLIGAGVFACAIRGVISWIIITIIASVSAIAIVINSHLVNQSIAIVIFQVIADFRDSRFYGSFGIIAIFQTRTGWKARITWVIRVIIKAVAIVINAHGPGVYCRGPVPISRGINGFNSEGVIPFVNPFVEFWRAAILPI